MNGENTERPSRVCSSHSMILAGIRCNIVANAIALGCSTKVLEISTYIILSDV